MRLVAVLGLLVALAIPQTAAAKVAKPRFVRNIATGETGWFSSPALVDLTGDKKLEIVAPSYSTFVFGAKGGLLGKGTATEGRVYAPSVVADLDHDGTKEIVVGGNDGTVAAYDLSGGKLAVKWKASTCSGGQCPETRGLAAGDLDRDGRIEVVATTTNTSPSGSQVFVFEPNGARAPGWPRYSAADATFNGAGNQGYGAYGENVGVGNVDRDPQLEVVVTFDNHQINVFNHDGTSVLASPWYTNRQSQYAGRRLGWGQFIRWLSARVEANHYHRHVGDWPDVRKTPWLQWTASPPSIADLDRDGRNEVIGVPNVEKKEPYETQAYAFMVLDGAYGNRSARRHKGFGKLPLTSKPAVRGERRLLPAERHPGADDRQHGGQPAAGDRRPDPRRVRLRDQPDRQAAMALRLRAWACEDVRLRGRCRRPGRLAGGRSSCSASTGRSRTRGGLSCCRRPGTGSTTSACAIRARTATGSACRPRPRSATSTTTATSRSSSRRSTTGSTSTASRARRRSAPRGRPAAATSCAAGPSARAAARP